MHKTGSDLLQLAPRVYAPPREEAESKLFPVKGPSPTLAYTEGEFEVKLLQLSFVIDVHATKYSVVGSYARTFEYEVQAKKKFGASYTITANEVFLSG